MSAQCASPPKNARDDPPAVAEPGESEFWDPEFLSHLDKIKAEAKRAKARVEDLSMDLGYVDEDSAQTERDVIVCERFSPDAQATWERVESHLASPKQMAPGTRVLLLHEYMANWDISPNVAVDGRVREKNGLGSSSAVCKGAAHACAAHAFASSMTCAGRDISAEKISPTLGRTDGYPELGSGGAVGAAASTIKGYCGYASGFAGHGDEDGPTTKRSRKVAAEPNAERDLESRKRAAEDEGDEEGARPARRQRVESHHEADSDLILDPEDSPDHFAREEPNTVVRQLSASAGGEGARLVSYFRRRREEALQREAAVAEMIEERSRAFS
ncbi:hypothetical protein B0H19DRAFT_1299012 [Mycena capillaripes]|nr:hypothetical protein B0H19DRAFT_1299012 [Mycena capillaripes]